MFHEESVLVQRKSGRQDQEITGTKPGEQSPGRIKKEEASMVHISTQIFFERHSGEKHTISITFWGISPVSRGYYRVDVDNEFYSTHDMKADAYDEVVDIIKCNNWTSINPL